MATLQTVKRSIDKLSAAYDRKPLEITYDAFCEALADIGDEELDVATTQLLRSGNQFRPSAAELHRAALDYRQECRDRERHDDTDRRLQCVTCDDSGHVLTFHRRWLFEHRSDICVSWFVNGWVRDAYLWCLRNLHEDFLQTVICNCDSRNVNAFRKQIERWDAREPGDKKIGYPAFRRWYDDTRDCLIPLPMPAEGRPEYYARILLAWRELDAQQRKWEGNWSG